MVLRRVTLPAIGGTRQPAAVPIVPSTMANMFSAALLSSGTAASGRTGSPCSRAIA